MSLEDLSKELEDLKNVMNNLYLPKHLQEMMKKVGKMETSVTNSNKLVQFCFCFCFLFVVIMLCLIIFIMLYCYKNYKRFLFQYQFHNDVKPTKLTRSKSI